MRIPTQPQYVPDHLKIYWVLIPVALIVLAGIIQRKPKLFNLAEILKSLGFLSFQNDDKKAYINLVTPLLFRIAYADDGIISNPEKEGLREILKIKLGLSSSDIEQAKTAFKKTRDVKIEKIASEYSRAYAGNTPMKVLLIVLLYRLAGKNGQLHKSQDEKIIRVGIALGLRESSILSLRDTHGKNFQAYDSSNFQDGKWQESKKNKNKYSNNKQSPNTH